MGWKVILVRGIISGPVAFWTKTATGPEHFSGLGAVGAGNDASPEDSFGTCGILDKKCDRSVGFLRDLVHWRREMMLVRGIISGPVAFWTKSVTGPWDFCGTWRI